MVANFDSNRLDGTYCILLLIVVVVGFFQKKSNLHPLPRHNIIKVREGTSHIFRLEGRQGHLLQKGSSEGGGSSPISQIWNHIAKFKKILSSLEVTFSFHF